MKSYFFKQSILGNLLIIFSAVTIFTFTSCDKEEITTNTNEPIVNDNYYVKYTISCSYPYVFSNWSVSTPEGTYTKNDYQTRGWEEVYGPVKKGFKCNVNVKNGQPNIKISVSKNNEPFTLKATKIGVGSVSYTIDF